MLERYFYPGTRLGENLQQRAGAEARDASVRAGDHRGNQKGPGD
jgi:hypothetical protein